MYPVMKKECQKGDVEVEFYLESNLSQPGQIFLMAKDVYGSRWFVLTITPKGLELCSDIVAKSGIPTDARGRIRIIHPEE